MLIIGEVIILNMTGGTPPILAVRIDGLFSPISLAGDMVVEHVVDHSPLHSSLNFDWQPVDAATSHQKDFIIVLGLS